MVQSFILINNMFFFMYVVFFKIYIGFVYSIGW